MANAIKCLGTISNENIIENNKVVVNGVQHKLSFINSSTEDNDVRYPEACTGTKTYDSATGVVTQHATSNEAFEGLVVNGDFRDGSTGWNSAGSSSISIDIGGMHNDGTNTENIYPKNLGVINELIDGVAYKFVLKTSGSAGSIYLTTNNASLSLYNSDVDGFGTFSGEFIGDNAGIIFTFTAGFVGSVEYLSVMPVTETVITSRQDFVLLESFHEKISDKDIVYPLGNVQYGAGSWEDITLSNNLIAQGYSAFGEWDTATTGYGVVWSTLSDEDKATFLQDPDNNIYLDDGELIQVRYRVRAVEGLGDDWLTTTTQESGGFNTLRYSASSIVRVQGEQVTPFSYTGSNNDGVYGQPKRLPQLGGVDGTFYGQRNSGIGAVLAHNGLCFAIPIALVQRMN